jgi:hypothetical protein
VMIARFSAIGTEKKPRQNSETQVFELATSASKSLGFKHMQADHPKRRSSPTIRHPRSDIPDA